MTTDGTPPGPARKVPVLDTAVDSFRLVFSNLDRFLALGWLPLLITFAGYMASDIVADVGGGENASVADWVTYIALEAAYWAMYAIFAVRWHRFYLLDERESVFSEFIVARNWRFLGYTLLLDFAPFAPMFIMGHVAIETTNVLFGLYSWAASILIIVLLRFSLVLPGTAVDRPLGLGEAWRNMRGNTWRFIGASFLVVILYVIPFWIVSAVFGQSLSGGITNGASEPTIGAFFATNAAMAIFGFLATAVGITVLSKFYRHIVGGETGEGGAAAGP